MIRTVREAELEMQVAGLKQELAKLRWAAGPRGNFGMTCVTEQPELMSIAPEHTNLRVMASVDILRHVDVSPDGEIVLHARARGKQGEMGFRTYIREIELISTRDAAEYMVYLHERACHKVATFFNKEER